MAKTRQLVLVGAGAGASGAGPLGTRREVVRTLAKYNTAPDGARDGAGILHGPGLRLELPMVDDKDEVAQALVTLIEEDTAWAVLNRLCRQVGWRMVDPESGRSFGA